MTVRGSNVLYGLQEVYESMYDESGLPMTREEISYPKFAMEIQEIKDLYDAKRNEILGNKMLSDFAKKTPMQKTYIDEDRDLDALYLTWEEKLKAFKQLVDKQGEFVLTEVEQNQYSLALQRISFFANMEKLNYQDYLQNMRKSIASSNKGESFAWADMGLHTLQDRYHKAIAGKDAYDEKQIHKAIFEGEEIIKHFWEGQPDKIQKSRENLAFFENEKAMIESHIAAQRTPMRELLKRIEIKKLDTLTNGGTLRD